ncbi:MAG: type II toxin-antitoxin system VapC family toxin [Candidatus Bathyarchaeota archaeon]|jgi:predicted nucleic acid-binding protein
MTTQILDASTLLLLIKRYGEKAFEILKASTSIPLIYYEIGNAIRTGAAIHQLMTPLEAEKTLEKIHTGIELMTLQRQENVQDSKQILENSLDHNLTYYDSAYLTAAEKEKAALITDDKRLTEAAKNANITTSNIDHLVRK